MDSKEISELFHGKEPISKAEQFQAELLKIEELNKGFFEERKGRSPIEQHDKLHNHYVIRIEGQRVGFMFHPDTPLPQSIKDQCLEAFRQIFPE